MLKKRFSLSIGAPTVLVSLLLLGLCILAGWLLGQERATSEQHSDDVSSAKTAHDLQENIMNLVSLLQGPVAGEDKKPSGTPLKKIENLNAAVRKELANAQALADKPREREIVGNIEECLNRYFDLWKRRDTDTDKQWLKTVEECIDILNARARPLCRDLWVFNTIEGVESEKSHRQTVNLVVNVLLGVGIVGALAGLLVGIAVHRRLRHDIYHLSVRVQDAASKLRQDLPAVALQEDADLTQIQQQMQVIATEIERVVKKLHQRELEVLRAEQLAALGQLAAGVAHELRNPLTSIKLLVQTLREDTEPGAAHEDLHVIELEVRRMERCLQTFLDYARPPQPERRPLDLTVPIHRTLALITGRARKQNVSVEFSAPLRPIMAVADAEQLCQLLLNLALNALDAMPLGGTLTFTLAEEAGEAELTVCDNGPGISETLLPALFQPFASSKETGLGLGLVTSRRIAETHGGVLMAANRVEGGACFTLRLPLQGEASSAARQLQSA